MTGELGKASLDLEANLGPFERNVTSADATSERLKGTLEALASVADVAQGALNDIKLGTGQAATSRVTAEEILKGVRGIGEESRTAALEMDRVSLSETQASETEASALRMDRALDGVGRNADQARRKLERVRLAGGRNGAGIGPFGSGFGRVGVLGTAVGVGALTAPAAAPAAIGLLAGIPTLAAAGAGALGTLLLAFSGVAKAIGGNKKAFDELTSSQKQFVLTVRSLDGFLDRLKQISAQSLFPGLTKGLRAALSPGTVSAIETALVQLGHALGSAGAAWGKYFGSARFQQIFGPLMKSAARTIGVLSDAMLHLFDALGVLARAAIPLTNWITSAIDKGAKFVDTWLRAKDATGQLGGAMREAKTSLRLVAGLAASLLRVVFELGKALYPVAKVAIKALTDGLNALSGMLHRNEGDIRAIVGGALRGFIGVVKLAATGVGVLWHGLQGLIGHKATIVAAIGAIGVAIALSLGPESAAILGALVAVGLIKKHWRAIAGFFGALGHEIVQAFKYVWYLIEVGALKAALKVVEPFSHLPGVLGGWARKAKNAMQGELNRLHAPNMNWSELAARDGALTGAAWSAAFAAQTAKNQKQIKQNVLNMPPLPFDFWLRQHPGGTRKQYDEYVKAFKLAEQLGKDAQRKHHRHHSGSDPKPGTHAWYMKYLGYDPTRQPTFAPPPPFKDSGTGSGSKAPVIPGTASHLLALASQQASIAATTQNVAKERKALEREITDLEKADKILIAKWKTAHGKVKTELFNAITATQNKIRAAQKKLRESTGKGAGSSKLDYALAQAKVAVENALEGSKAWDRAVSAEEKDLKAEIRYWEKRAHNDKLSLDARTAALKKELSYQKQLKALLAPIKAAASANIAQFLSTFADIENTFGPNAFPYQGPGATPPPGGKTNTHLHDIKNEARQTNRHLQAIRSGTRFPGSQAAQGAAMAVTG